MSASYRVAFYADIHYRTDESMDYWLPPAFLDVDIILLGGDIHYEPNHLAGMLRAMRATQRDSTTIVVVPGNSEYGRHDLHQARARYQRVTDGLENTVFLDDEAVELAGGIRIIGSTLWSHIPAPEIRAYTEMLEREQLVGIDGIRLGDRYLTLEDANELHARARTFLAQQLRSLSSADRQRTIVCTHYWPTLQFAAADGYRRKWLHCEGSDMDDLIRDHGPKFWLCGHVHQTRHVTIANTQISSNPRAGDGERFNPDFLDAFTVRIG